MVSAGRREVEMQRRCGFNITRGITNKGWYVSDSLGKFVFAGVAWDFSPHPILDTEALALKEAIHGSITMQLENVTFESESQRVTQAIHSNNNDIYAFSFIIWSIQSLLQSYPNFEVKFVKRQPNTVAHTLMKASDSRSRRSFIYVIPPYIKYYLVNDMS
ncbi:unnamed protein product [Lathyrus oleraceus]